MNSLLLLSSTGVLSFEKLRRMFSPFNRGVLEEPKGVSSAGVLLAELSLLFLAGGERKVDGSILLFCCLGEEERGDVLSSCLVGD